MSNKLKNAFDNIHAEDALKTNTIGFLNQEINKHPGINKRFLPKRFAVSLACVLIIFFSGYLYYTPSAYVDVDINPSVEIVLNRFDRVIDTYAYNTDGEDILAGIDLNHKEYNDAIGILVNAVLENNTELKDNLISVTLQSNDGENESVMLSNIESSVLECHNSARVETFSVDSDTRNTAHGLNLSPAKYLAIQELTNVDPTATVEGCRNHSIGRIKQLTEEYSTNHQNVPGSNNMQRGRGHHGMRHGN